MKTLVIRDIMSDVIIGVYDFEKIKTSKVRFCVTIKFDFKKDMSSFIDEDNVENTVDYDLFIKSIQNVSSKRPYQLIETLAESCLRALETRLSLIENVSIQSVDLEVTKLYPGENVKEVSYFTALNFL
ncbi:dihydroneopterin aldolase [bacterium]|nr:dihydroneopterin aldolase [bacterium]